MGRLIVSELFECGFDGRYRGLDGRNTHTHNPINNMMRLPGGGGVAERAEIVTAVTVLSSRMLLIGDAGQVVATQAIG